MIERGNSEHRPMTRLVYSRPIRLMTSPRLKELGMSAKQLDQPLQLDFGKFSQNLLGDEIDTFLGALGNDLGNVFVLRFENPLFCRLN